MLSNVSFRYGRALVDIVTAPAAVEAGMDSREIAVQLGEFQDLLTEHSDLRILFSTPAVAPAKKKAILAELAPRLRLAPVTRNFLQVVIDNDRMSLLGEIAEAFESLLHERLGVVVAEISTARPLEESERKQLASTLHSRTGKQVRMNFTLDPELIGGVVARIGGTIYDGSVRGQLQRIQSELTTE